MGFSSGSKVDESIPARLILWFRAQARDLPWRQADERGLRDPYRCWIAEIMLQQTRVEAVQEYFLRFFKLFPTLNSLAEAELEDVLRAWAGLGYYRRARMLHSAARTLQEQHQGQWPSSSAELRQLPGIGAYTAAAVASLAFGEAIPVVDGNVKRVVARYLALPLPADALALEKAARAEGERWMVELPTGDLQAPGLLNEALMELGATICLPCKPRCEACPLATSCRAFEAHQVGDYPRPKRKKKWVDLELVYLVHRVGMRVHLLSRQTGWSLGLFEPPSAPLAERDPLAAAWELSGAALIGETELQYRGLVRHSITHHRIRAHVVLFEASEEVVPPSAQWRCPEAVPLTGLAKKVLACCQG